MEKRYIFKSWNDNYDFDYDIQGEAFKNLINLCAEYCKYVSFWYMNANDHTRQHYSELEPFLIEPPKQYEKYLKPYCYDLSGQNKIRVCFYRVCPELLETMFEISTNLFTWLDGWGSGNPEDPTFYREDGSVFLDTVVHDSKCVLSPHANEDIQAVISENIWEIYEGPFPLKLVTWY